MMNARDKKADQHCARCGKKVNRLIGGSGACGPCVDEEDERKLLLK